MATLLCVLALAAPPKLAQEPRPETRSAFQIHAERNLVVVRAVVRGRDGKAISGLGKEDFRIFDNGKAQEIIDFSVETVGGRARAPEGPRVGETKPTAPEQRQAAPAAAGRYVALFFDDLHLQFPDSATTRDAASRYLSSALQMGDRVAILTTSGEVKQEFTEDRDRLRAALSQIRPRGRTYRDPNACPDIGDYQAYLISVKHDRDAQQEAMKEALRCGRAGDPAAADSLGATSGARGSSGPGPGDVSSAAAYIEAEASAAWGPVELEARASLASLDALVRRISAMPGQRSVVLVSPGFLIVTQTTVLDEIIDRALRSNVVISSLDARGLYTEFAGRVGTQSDAMPDPGRNLRMGQDTRELFLKRSMEHQAVLLKAGVLGELAEATGGVFFHNSNDMDEGFRSAGELPEIYYTLAFSPSKLKPDGRFHTLKVSLAAREHYAIQARRGYFAPEKDQEAKPAEEERVTSAIFSQDEVHGLPVEFRAEAVKSDRGRAVVAVFIHIDVARLRLCKEGGLNINKLNFHTAVFDHNGRYVAGNERAIEFRLKDEALRKLSAEGFTARTNLPLPPGRYRVREVVTDSVTGDISALNHPIEIPL